MLSLADTRIPPRFLVKTLYVDRLTFVKNTLAICFYTDSLNFAKCCQFDRKPGCSLLLIKSSSPASSYRALAVLESKSVLEEEQLDK